MRILHLVDLSDHACTAPLACAAVIRAHSQAPPAPPTSHTVWTIGHSPPPALLPRPERRLPAPLGSPMLAHRPLRHALERDASRFDLITCWSAEALACLRLATRRHPPAVGVLASSPELHHPAPARRAMAAALDAFPVLTFSTEEARRWRAAGAADVRTAPPSLPFPAPHPDARRRTRELLDIAPTELLVVLLADPPGAGDARRFAFLTGLLGVAGTPVVALVHDRSAQFRRGARFMRECGRAWRFVCWNGPLCDALPACDLALADLVVTRTHPIATPTGDRLASACGALSAAVAIAAGVPVLVPSIPIGDELRAAGLPVTLAVDPSCHALSAASIAALTARSSPTIAGDVPGALPILNELWLELLNTPAPGFPLSRSSPVPQLHAGTTPA